MFWAIMEFEPLAGGDESLAFATKSGRWVWTGFSYGTLAEAKERLSTEQFARPNAHFKIRPFADGE